MEGSPTFLIVAGEASGDLHGAKVMRELRRRIPGVRFVGVGGEAMEAEGLDLLFHVRELSVMGFVEVIPKLGRVLSMLGRLRRHAETERPDAAILIDAPDFNLRLARDLQLLEIPVAYLIAPMVWAWRRSRVRELRRLDRLLCIYPFEEPWFRERGVPAVYVGNPLMDDPLLADLPDKRSARKALGLPEEGEIVALLPGSRRAELTRLLPVLVETAQRLKALRPEAMPVLPLAPGLDRAEVEAAVGGTIRIQEGRATELLSAADAAAVCSGTATLQAALALCPSVVIYKGNPLSFAIAKRIVDLTHASIANLLADEPFLPELLQDDCSAEAIVDALGPLLDGGAERERMLDAMRALRMRMGAGGASERAAAEIEAMWRATFSEQPGLAHPSLVASN